jgi:hypothetical protein
MIVYKVDSDYMFRPFKALLHKIIAWQIRKPHEWVFDIYLEGISEPVTFMYDDKESCIAAQDKLERELTEYYESKKEH